MTVTVCVAEVMAVVRQVVQFSTGVVQVVTSPLSLVDTTVEHSDSGTVTVVLYVVHVADCSTTVTVAPVSVQMDTTSIRS